MIPIEFVKEAPKQKAVWAYGYVEEKNEKNLPKVLLDALKFKNSEHPLETFIFEDTGIRRYIAMNLTSCKTKQSKEEAGSLLSKKILEGPDEILVLDIRKIEEEGLALLSGILLASWRFNKYKTILSSEEKKELSQIFVLCENPKKTEQHFKRSLAIIEGVLFARSLTSEPPNVLYPFAYAERLKELESLGVSVEILNKESLEKLGMTAILAASKGSSQEPFVAIMSWNGLNSSSQPFAIVGKGVCFDSGGLCLKPSMQQLEMKWDKSGAGVVSGLMKTLAIQKAPVHVVGIIGLIENMPDGNATRTSDVIKTMSGQTIEIVNTDCEGRLVLADCLWYAAEHFKPKAMVDLGTLTVETMACLGETYGGLYSNSKELAKELRKAGDVSGDLLWELPFGPSFAKQIESPIADIKNEGVILGGENAAAAEFLKRFVKDIPWAHLDIAGVSWTKEDLPLAKKGVTGFGVRLLEEWIHYKTHSEQPLY